MSGSEQDLRRDLLSVESAARRLAWSAERPWRAETHVWDEDGPVIDLHDLDVPLALDVVERVVGPGAQLSEPPAAVVFVVGRGQHRHGVKGEARDNSPLAAAVRARLGQIAVDGGHRVMLPRPGRIALVRDVRAASARVTGRLSGWFWLGAFGFGALVTWALPPVGLLLLAALALGFAAERRGD